MPTTWRICTETKTLEAKLRDESEKLKGLTEALH